MRVNWECKEDRITFNTRDWDNQQRPSVNVLGDLRSGYNMRPSYILFDDIETVIMWWTNSSGECGPVPVTNRCHCGGMGCRSRLGFVSIPSLDNGRWIDTLLSSSLYYLICFFVYMLTFVKSLTLLELMVLLIYNWQDHLKDWRQRYVLEATFHVCLKVA